MIDVDLTGEAILDDGAHELGIGIVAPFDLVLDREYWQWVPETVSLHITRTPNLELPVGAELATAVSDAEVVARATRDLAGAGPEVTVYACTSGSFIGGLAGETRLRRVMEEAGGHKLSRPVARSFGLWRRWTLDESRLALPTTAR